MRQEGEIVALLLLLFREDFFRERYRDVRLDSDETNYLVARDGTIVSSSNEARTGTPIDPSLAENELYRDNATLAMEFRQYGGHRPILAAEATAPASGAASDTSFCPSTRPQRR